MPLVPVLLLVFEGAAFYGYVDAVVWLHLVDIEYLLTVVLTGIKLEINLTALEQIVWDING